jgi:hypothetical protein
MTGGLLVRRAASATAATRDRPWRDPLPRWLSATVTLAICVMLGYALTAMPLAMVGALRPVPTLLLTGLVTAGLLWLARGLWAPAATTRTGPAEPRAGVAAVGIAVVVVASAVINAHFASEHLIADRDPGIYVWFGRWLADRGSLFVEHVHRYYSHQGGFIAQCPETCEGAPGGRLYVQFVHLLPLTLAAGAWIGGSALMLKVNAILGALSLLTFYAFGTRLVRPLVALGATLALAVNFVQVYFARDAYSEIIAQFFLFGGLFVLWDARAAWDRRRGLLAGLLLGTTCMARIDSFVYLIPLSAYVLGEIALATARERRRFAAAVGAGIAGPAALGAVDLYWFSRGYFHLESTELRGVGLALGAALVAGVGVMVIPRVWPRARTIALRIGSRTATAAALVVAGLAVFAYLVRPHLGEVTAGYDHPLAALQRQQGLPFNPYRTYAEQTMVWLSWYLGPVALVAGVAGLALAVRGVLAGRQPGLAPLAGVTLAITMLYVARPSIFPNQVWAMRRFLPVTIPGLLILGAWAAERAGEWIGSRRPAGRWLAPAVLVAAAVIVPAWQLEGMFDMREQAGALQAMKVLCDRLPNRAVVWTIAGSKESRLIQPVHAFCRVPTAQAPEHPPRKLVRGFARRLQREGRPLYVIAARRPPLIRLAGSQGRVEQVVVLHYTKLEESVAHRPQHRIRRRFAVYLVRM